MRNYERCWRKYHSPMLWKVFKAEHNMYKSILLEARTESLSEKINECNKDTKNLYSLINNLTSSKTENPMLDAESDEALVNTFDDYFMEKISKIRYKLQNHQEYSPEHRNIDQLIQFHPISTEYISKTIRQMSSKSVEWKITIIRPLLKKLNLTLIHSNYRPVSNLNFLLKVVEKVALDQFRSHCTNHRLIPDYQSAYPANYSCETALLKIVNDILWAMERQDITELIAIDLSVTFNMVDHNISLEVLHRNFGVAEVALDRFASCISPQYCRINVNNFYYIDSQLECGVPQGSVAGPMLYIVYASTMESVLEDSNQTEDTVIASNPRKKPDLHGFPNNHAVKTPLRALIDKLKYYQSQNLEHNALSIKNWMDYNGLKMNDGKTEFIMFGSKVQLVKYITNIIDINGT